MTFSDYAMGLLPFIFCGKSKADYFTELISNFIKDDAIDICKILEHKPNTLYRYIKGDSSIPHKEAQFLYDNRNRKKFSTWLKDKIKQTDSNKRVIKWLDNWGIKSSNPVTACTNLLENILLEIINSSPSVENNQDTDFDFKLIQEIQYKIQNLKRPKNIPVPKTVAKDEYIYVNELLLAYGDAEKIDSFSASDLSSYPNYADDLEDRRVDFYAAETIRRGVLELKGVSLMGQFDVLKEETYDNVKDTSRQNHPNGYECMLAVMGQAVKAPVTNYILGASPYWISGKIKKGVCHHLVNEKALFWVRKKISP